jgi:hypothetical protein
MGWPVGCDQWTVHGVQSSAKVFKDLLHILLDKDATNVIIHRMTV